MAAIASRVVSCRLRFQEVCKWRRCLTLSVRCRHTSVTSGSMVDHHNHGLERYKDLQNYFKRRLRATYHRFSNTPDLSMVHGNHHVYFIEDDSIYRVDKRKREPRPEQVLDLGEVSVGEKKTGVQRDRTQRIQWIVQRIRLSPREKHLAATLKTSNKEDLRFVVVRLGDVNSPASHHIVFTLDKVFSFEWATDEVLFYTTLERLQCSRVHRLHLTSSSSISSVYEETQPDVFLEVALTRDRQLLTINGNSRTSSEVLLVHTETPDLKPLLVEPRQPDLLYHVEHWRRRLIILANTGPGQEYQVVQAPLSKPSMASWETVFTPAPGTVVKDMDVVGHHCVLVAKTPTNELELIVIPLTNPKETYALQFPPWACAIDTKNPSLSDQRSVLEFSVSSPVHPPVPYCLNPAQGLLLSGLDSGSSPKNWENYTTTRLEACSQDGTSVPVTLFHVAAVTDLRQAPLLVHVYGAYGRDVAMEFCPQKRLMLEQGWALVFCHVRGGGERGLSWHRQACLEGKQRSMEDLRACLHHLHSSGISSPPITALTACSAGAVAVGALCNTHPDSVRAVTLQSPFLDVLGAMEDPSLPLTLEDREEWGDAAGNPKHKLAIASYCPLHNITPKLYPSMLLSACSGDARAPLAGVLKYAERLKKATDTHLSRETKPGSEPAPNIVVNIQPGANHLGPDDFELMLEEEALQLAFLYAELGLDPPRSTRKRR